MSGLPATIGQSQPGGGTQYIVCEGSGGHPFITDAATCQQLGGRNLGPDTGAPLPTSHTPNTGRWCESLIPGGSEWFSPYGDCSLQGYLTAPIATGVANVVGPIAGTGASPTASSVAAGVGENIAQQFPSLGVIGSAIKNGSFWKDTGLMVAGALAVLVGVIIWLK